jgi:phosphate transport system protein
VPNRFDEDITALKARLLEMGGLAAGMVRHTIAALVQRDKSLIAGVLEVESRMDGLQRRIDNEVLRLIAVYTPVARDLRELLMATRINGELERIGDQAVSICYTCQNLDLLEEPPIKPLVDLPRMAQTAEGMLHKALHAFVAGSAEESVEVVQADNEVDRLNDLIFQELLAFLAGDVHQSRRALGLILVARGFERVADHAVNIAEDVVFIVRGEDIRHVAAR